MKIAVFGASGLFGNTLVPILRSSGHYVTIVGRSATSDIKCDVLDVKKLGSTLNKLKPEIIINLVALTNVDECELDPSSAFLVNCRSVQNIVTWIETSEKSCHLFHLSTDQVYDGMGPHAENNIKLSNLYAYSKYTSELIARRVKSTVLRTNFFGRSNCETRASFSDWIYQNISKKNELTLFNDVLFSPLSMESLARIIVLLIFKQPSGTFNVGSRKGFSKYDFARLFVEKLKLDINHVKSVSIENASFLRAHRPRDMRLRVEKVEQELGVAQPTLEEEISRVIEDYRAEV